MEIKKIIMCPVLYQSELNMFPSDDQGKPAPGTLSDVKAVLVTINGEPASDPTAWIKTTDDEKIIYLQSTDIVGDVLEFEVNATLTTTAGVRAVTQRATLTVVNQLEPDQYRAIGNVAVAWALLEDRVHRLFAAIISIEVKTARLIAAQVRRIDAIFKIMQVAAAEKLDDAGCNELEEIKKQVKGLEELRHQYVHAVWSRTDNPSVARGELTTRSTPMELGPTEIAKIDQLAHDLVAAAARIISFVEKHRLRTA